MDVDEAPGTVTLVTAAARLQVIPADGGRWVSLQVAGHELLTGVELTGVEPQFLHGCYPMAPFAGRMGYGRLLWQRAKHQLPLTAGHHAMHGTVLTASWHVESLTTRSVTLTTDLGCAWPYSGQASQRLALTDGGLTALLTLTAEEAMPVTLGFHPWFRRRLDSGSIAVLELHAQSMYERGADGLPTGQLIATPPGPWDDCFVGANTAKLRWPGTVSLELRSNHDHWVVFDEHRDAVCIEPQTGPPNAVALGQAKTLEAGQSCTLEFSLAWSTADAP